MTVGGGDHLPLAARGMVSDTTSAALVAADGTVDWWCPGRFDADPLFTRLLDPAGSCLRVGPAAPGRPPTGSQRYREGTLVLATLLPGRESLVEVEDALTWDGGRRPGRLVRVLRVLRGPAHIAVELVPAGDPRDVAAWSEGVAFAGFQVRCGLPFRLSSVPPPAPARPIRRLVAQATTTLDTGATLVVTVDAGRAPPPLSPDAAARALARTGTAWRRMSAAIDPGGLHADAVARSLLVVTALSGAGAPVAAPTTSLPRVVGGERNTDGRAVAVTTAAAWAATAAASGLHEQADAATTWLAGALEHAPPMPSVLGVDAAVPSGEAHLPHLGGWRRSQPVVAGTNAPDRLTTEPASAVVACAAAIGGRPEGAELLARWPLVVAHADWLADHWDERDATVWDLRASAGPWVAPRLAARHALAQVAAAARRRNPLDLDAVGWSTAARDIDAWLASDAIAPGGVLRAATGRDGASDAALARAAWLGPWPPRDPVVGATLDRLLERNGHGPWVHPVPPDLDDGMPGVEPASVVATLWAARALALAGRTDEAHERVEAVAGLGGGLFLLPESVDATDGSALGNLPASAAHVAFVEAALALRQP